MKSNIWKASKAVKSKHLPKRKVPEQKPKQKPEQELEQKPEQKPKPKKTYDKLTDTSIKTEEAKNG